MPRTSTRLLLSALVTLCLVGATRVGEGAEIAYQGELKQSGSRFTGTALMKFAFVKGDSTLWSNDSTSEHGLEPETSVAVQVLDGLFTVHLGDPSIMRPIAPSAIGDGVDVRLRVWVKTSGSFEQLEERLMAVPLAMRSEQGASGTESIWSRNATGVYVLDENVSIGTTPNPGHTLLVRGDAVGPPFRHGTILSLEVPGFGAMGFGRDSSENGFIQSASTGGANSIVINPEGGGLGVGEAPEPAGVVKISGKRFGRPYSVGNLLDLRVDGAGSFTFGKLNNEGSSFIQSSKSGNAAIVLNPEGGNVGIGDFTEERPNQRLHVKGTTKTAVLEITGGADLAEPFEVVPSPDVSVAPGLVVAIDPDRAGQLIVSSTAYDRRVVGVVSGANGVSPGVVLRSENDARLANGHNVALSGRVYVRATACNGPITPGDLLVASGRHGHAMKGTDLDRARGATIGKAMSVLKAGEGFVLLLVQPQ